MNGLTDHITAMLAQALRHRLDRHYLLSSNVANADTPGYTPVDMRFEDLLGQAVSARALTTTSKRHLPADGAAGGQPELFYDPSCQPGLDGNSVSLDREMARIAENTIQYNATARALQKKLAMLRYAVDEGR